MNGRIDKYKEYIDFAKVTLVECGKIARKWHGKECPDNNLFINEYVSNLVNSQILKSLNETFPTHALFTKGSNEVGEAEYEWICDPLDGAFIYSRGLTNCVISMTLVHDGIPIVAAIYQPFSDDFYIAAQDCGVFKNDKPIHIGHEKLCKFRCINEEWWPGAYYDIDNVVHNIARQYETYPLHFGSVVYSACLVAEGKLTASLFGGRLVGKNHEAAAVMLLMKEAGGAYTDLSGAKIGFKGIMHGFIISTKEAHAEIMRSVEKYLETKIA
jgi:myo-inositol-1(or 4)-monophosphatase